VQLAWRFRGTFGLSIGQSFKGPNERFLHQPVAEPVAGPMLSEPGRPFP
jgi:hypothetical protein